MSDGESTPTQNADVIVVKGRMIPTTNYVQGWNWLCKQCGWRGVDLFGERGAIAEARSHFEKVHPEIAVPRMETRSESSDV